MFGKLKNLFLKFGKKQSNSYETEIINENIVVHEDVKQSEDVKQLVVNMENITIDEDEEVTCLDQPTEEFDFYAMFEKNDVIATIGDVVTVNIVDKTANGYVAIAKGSGQEIFIPNKEYKQELVENSSCDIIIYYQDDAETLGSIIRLESSHERENLIVNGLHIGDIVAGEVIGYDKPYFHIMVSGFEYDIYEKKIDYLPLQKPEFYIGKTFDFEIMGIRNSKDGLQVDFSRFGLALKQREENIKNYQLGDQLTVTNFMVNSGGLETNINNVRVFVPFRELGYPGEFDSTDYENSVTTPFDVEVIGNSNDTLICSRKKLIPNPFFEFAQNHEKNSIVNAQIIRVYDYGYLCQINRQVCGFLFFDNVEDINLRMQLQKLKLYDYFEATIMNVVPEKQKLYLTAK